jgi:predicted ATP-grasp superfamily ATP-dependent carboligase
VEGVSCAAVYVAARRRAVLLGITRQLIGATWAGAGGFRYVGSLGPAVLQHGAIETFRRIGDVLSNAFQLTGLFGVDAMVDETTVWVVDVNPRYTASVEVLEWSTGVPSIAMHLAACCHGVLPDEPDWQQGMACGKAILHARRLGRMPEGLSHDLARRSRGSSWPRFADIPAPGEPINPYAPVATVLARGADVATVERRLRRRVAALEGRLYDQPETLSQNVHDGVKRPAPSPLWDEH